MNQNVKDVINILRRDVSMPWVYPIYDEQTYGLRWTYLFNHFKIKICPLGLHPLSEIFLPRNYLDFKKDLFTLSQVQDFISWWNNLKDSKKAFKRIWG